MAYTKTILCLANSYKMGGRCIAGREITEDGFGGWIRPVTARPSHEINGLEMRYREGGTPSLLDRMQIDFLNPQPYGFQTENHLIDDSRRWSVHGRADWRTVADLAEPIRGPLWLNGESTYYGRNDKIPEAAANDFRSSLMLIRPENARISVEDEHQYVGGTKRNVRAHFEYSQCYYVIKVTDPLALSKYNSRGEGEYEVQDALFCISLGEIFNGFAFKLVAAILTPDMWN